MKQIKPKSIETNVAGVHAFLQPPDGFSPYDASAEDLIRYGFPLRPTETESLKLWKTLVPPKTNRIVPIFEETNISHRRKPSHISRVIGSEEPDTVVEGGTNWSGVVIVDRANTPFANWGNMIVGRWNVPNVSCPSGAGGSYFSSHWVGLDGYDGGLPEFLNHVAC